MGGMATGPASPSQHSGELLCGRLLWTKWWRGFDFYSPQAKRSQPHMVTPGSAILGGFYASLLRGARGSLRRRRSWHPESTAQRGSWECGATWRCPHRSRVWRLNAPGEPTSRRHEMGTSNARTVPGEWADMRVPRHSECGWQWGLQVGPAPSVWETGRGDGPWRRE
jgi:hypothetical protein